jgi:hypothetical protein
MGPYIISVKMIEINSGDEEILYKRQGSRCHFKKWFSYNNYEIQLRLDWKDIINKEPMLDADIRDKTTGKLLRNGKWHHTKMEYDDPNRDEIIFF